MNAEIISVGTELLLGDILNTNAQYLARELAGLGFGVYYQTVVGDNPGRLRWVVETAKARSQVLVFTGGLGPTDDDLTKATVAGAFNDTLAMDAEEMAKIEAFFSKRGLPMGPNNAKQAMLPQRGGKLPNPNGTAPGAIFKDNGCTAFLLPGPPREMRPMFDNQVRPLLAQMQEGSIRSQVLRVFGVGESELENQVRHLLEGANPTAALYAKTGEVHIRVTARAATAEEAEAMCSTAAQDFYAILGDKIYSGNGDDPETVVVRLLEQRGQTLATAESCTGGMLSERITSVAGASNVFGFGVCTYSNEIKQKALRVRGDTLAKHGAVSSQVAAEMAFGAAAYAGADYGAGITGIAGPGGGSPQKPVGLVYVAACCGGRVAVKKLMLGGRGREVVRLLATHHALDMVRRLALELPLQDALVFNQNEPADYEAAAGT